MRTLTLDQWLIRLYWLNAIGVAAALLCFIAMFGILTGSVTAGLAFPAALASMAANGDAWGIWMLSPIYLLPVLMLARRRPRRPTA